jgi:hypothetical protein
LIWLIVALVAQGQYLIDCVTLGRYRRSVRL